MDNSSKCLGFNGVLEGDFGGHRRAVVWGCYSSMFDVDYLERTKPSNFDGFDSSPSELKLLLLQTLYDRWTARSSHSCSNLLEFLDLCNLS